MFQATAADRPAPTTATTSLALTSTMLETVAATAPPKSSGPTKFPIIAIVSAVRGLAARVATSAAIESAASCRPFVAA